jgi:hypothetical protein
VETIQYSRADPVEMPFNLKIFFSIACVVVCVLIYFAKSSGNSAGKDWFWRGGKNDPFRKMLFRVDGSMRSYAKACILVLFALFLFALWFLLPPA